MLHFNTTVLKLYSFVTFIFLSDVLVLVTKRSCQWDLLLSVHERWHHHYPPPGLTLPVALGPSPPAPSHTLPVNHRDFIDITGITDETLSVSQLACKAIKGNHTQTQTCMFTNMYCTSPPPTVCTQQLFPVWTWLSYPLSNIRENAIMTDIEVCASVTGSQACREVFQDTCFIKDHD